MPQLDFIIVFPQIFWLLLVFLITYTILVHFFLPLFVKSLKARRLIILRNVEISSLTQKEFDLKQHILSSTINKNFHSIRIMLETEISNIFLKKSATELEFIDSKLITVLYYNVLYYNFYVLDSIPLKSKFSHLRFND